MLGKKIPTIIGLLIIFVGIGMGWYFIGKNKTKIDPNIAPNKVTITNVSDNKFSVSWVTKNPTIGYVEYGKVGEKLEKKAFDDRGGEASVFLTHHITVDELQPNTVYTFRLVSGSKTSRFDNGGKPYSVTTGEVISNIPAARSFYGSVSGASEDAIVYFSIPGGYPASMPLKNNGAYTLSATTIRTSDLKSFLTYDPSATVVGITIETGAQTTRVNASTANVAPVPTITLGKNEDFLNPQGEAQVAEKTEVETPVTTPTTNPTEPQVAEIFNVEPLAETGGVNAVTGEMEVTLTNPSVEGEVLSSLRPEFSGEGSSNMVFTISLTGQRSISDTVRVPSNGKWVWTPPIDLKAGKQKVTITYTDEDDKTQTIERSFTASVASTSKTPAFEASPSGSTKSPSPTPRTNMPATESGVPVTGVMTPLFMSLGVGVVSIVIGAIMFAL